MTVLAADDTDAISASLRRLEAARFAGAVEVASREELNELARRAELVRSYGETDAALRERFFAFVRGA